MYVWVLVYMYGCLCVCVGACVNAWVFVCMYGCLCICMGACVYVHDSIVGLLRISVHGMVLCR